MISSEIVRSEDQVKHNHDPCEDALYEAVLLVDIMRYNEGLPWIPLKFARDRVMNIENESIWYI
jgi:hypothetical protein